MGLIHVYGEVPANENRCLIRIINPLLNTREPYTLKLLKVFSKAKSSLTQDIPITIRANDSPYFIYSEFSLPEPTEYIINETQKIVRLLKEKLQNKISKFVKEGPTPSFESVQDNNLRGRYFNLRTSKNTFLFSNNKYFLYLLGYDDNDFTKININTTENSYIRRHVQNTLNVVTTDCSTIYIVNHNINQIPLKRQQNGQLKWKVGDKVEDIYFISKRQNRNINRRSKRTINLNTTIVKRQKREDKFPYTASELNKTIISKNDSKEQQIQKISTKSIWDNRTAKLEISATSDVGKYNAKEMKKNSIIYWRNQIVKALNPQSDRQRVVYIPAEYYNESDKNKELKFTADLIKLTEDNESYIKLGATKILDKFYDLILPHLTGKNTVGLYTTKIRRIKDEQENLKELYTLSKTNADQEHADQIKCINDAYEQNPNSNSITEIVQSTCKISRNKNLAEDPETIDIDDDDEFEDAQTILQSQEDEIENRLETERQNAEDNDNDNGNGHVNNDNDNNLTEEEKKAEEDRKKKEEEERKKAAEERKKEEEAAKRLREEERLRKEQEDARNFDIDTRKTVIGFLKDKKDEVTNEFIIKDFNKDTTADVVGRDLKEKIDLTVNALNIQFQVVNNSDDDTIILSQRQPQTNIDSEASINIYFSNLQDSMFLRLNKLIKNSENEEITWKLENFDNNLVSENFMHNNPWKDAFYENLPLLTVPVNAGSEINAYLTNIGTTSSLGLILEDGEILHSVKMTMRGSKEETFYIYFYSPFNTPVKFEYPSYLYFHFEIEPLYEK